MPKGTVSDEQLAQSLKGMGGFGSLAGDARPKRDHPFRISAPEPKPVSVIDVERPSRVEEKSSPKAAEAHAVEERAGERVREEKVISIEERRAEVELDVERAEPLPTSTAARPLAKKKPSRTSVQVSGRKADIYSERITLQLSPKMRDKADAMAKDLQRLRTSKEERITANTVMRVAVKLVLDKFKPGVGETVANSEEELFELVKKQLCGE